MRGSGRAPFGAIIGLVVAAAASGRAEAPIGRATDTPEVDARAKESFQRGVQLYDERDFSGAGVEFRRAYNLVPNFRILFNQGRVAVELHEYASALDLFTRYLSEGGDQVPPERRRELDQEIERLKTRVGQLRIVSEPGAEVYLDDSLVGRTPLAPLSVNVGRHRLELRPGQGRAELQVVDCPGQETVVVRFAQSATHTATALPIESAETLISRTGAKAGQNRHEGARTPWLGWAATGLCVVGAAVFGVLAYRASDDLRDLRDSYPVSPDTLEGRQRDTRIFSGIADGFLAGALVLGGLSLYFSFDHESRGPDASGASSGPGSSSITISGHF